VQNNHRQFVLGLRDLGNIEGRDFAMEDRNADGHLERLPVLAADLVRLPVDIIIATGEEPIRAAMQTTGKIPIVMTIIADPIGSGIVSSLARPGGNVTGLSVLASDMASKRVELLKEVVSSALRVAVLWNPNNRSKIEEWKGTQAAAKNARLTLISVEVRTPEEFGPAFGSILRERPDAMITLTDSLTVANRERIGDFALSNNLPMIGESRDFVVAGGLACYGVSRPDLFRRAASYVHKIMLGAKPADLPVEQPTKFELVINLKTTKALGLTVPQSLLATADEVIE
jgi:putative ABC transport system substrate-binding protein